MIDDEDIEGRQLHLLPYGGEPPHVKGSHTSRMAAESVRGITGKLRVQVAKAVAASAERGMTCDEVEVLLGMRHQTASARCTELKEMKWIVKTGERRRTRSGRAAVVYVVADEMREKLLPRPRVRDEDLL